MNNNIPLRGGCSGHFTLHVIRPNGDRRKVADFPNLITDIGLDRMGSGGIYLTYCQVGSGSTPPAESDVALAAYLAHSSDRVSTATGALPEAPYYAFIQKTWRFGVGEAAGNISEVGIGWSTNTNLYSRALILDAEGNPTTLTVQPDEILEVFYETRYYPLLEDSTGTVTLDGSLGGVYGYVIRGANYGKYGAGASVSGMYVVPGGFDNSAAPSVTHAFRVSSDPIAGIESEPPNNQSSGGVSTQYLGNRAVQFTVSLGLDDGNIDIRSARMRMGVCQFQIEFNPPIPKTSDDVLGLVFTVSWGRRDAP